MCKTAIEAMGLNPFDYDKDQRSYSSVISRQPITKEIRMDVQNSFEYGWIAQRKSDYLWYTVLPMLETATPPSNSNFHLASFPS